MKKQNQIKKTKGFTVAWSNKITKLSTCLLNYNDAFSI